MWSTGLSKTESFYKVVNNPDGTPYHSVGFAGYFFFISWQWPLLEKLFGMKRYFELYSGWRPTPGFNPRYDKSLLTRLLAKIGIGYTNYTLISIKPFRTGRG